MKEGREIGLDLVADRYNIVLLQIFSDHQVEGYSEERNAAEQAIEKMTEKMKNILMVELGLEGWGFIIKETDEARSVEQTLDEFLEKLQEMIGTYEGIEYFAGVGRAVARLSELNRCFEEANRAFAYRYLRTWNQVIYSEKEPGNASVDENLNLSALNVEKMDRKSVEQFLKTGLRGEVHHFIDEYFASLGEKNIQSLLLRQYVTMDMYFAAVAMLEQLGYDRAELVHRCGDFQTMTTVFSTVEQTKEYLQGVFESAVDLREAVSQKKYSSLLKDARAYIERNYDQEDISLNKAAASVNLSPNQTFIEFLTEVRMERAKELLRSTSMKMSEIAFAVGYKDAHYFSYLFKKTQDCTPREYRSRA